MKKFSVFCLGCKVNTYEIEAIKQDFISHGYEFSDLKDADYIIINTCAVTNTAASKSRQHIHSFSLKYPNAKLIVMGCYVQGFKDELLDVANIIMYVGTSNRDKILENINTTKTIDLVQDSKEFKCYEDLKTPEVFENTRAFLKIQDGCNNYCSYCIIPYLRGNIKSRDKESILQEVNTLVLKGYKEIVLTGISTGSYGKDLDNYSFSNLIEEILAVDGLYRLRISSIEESEIDDKLINLLQTNSKLACHLHIPLQAGSNHILKLMNRKYDRDTFIKKLNEIKMKVKNISLSTDVIVGFPQESDMDFEDTLDLCRIIGFSKIHVFPFSSRKNTVASKLSNQLKGDIKKNRAHQLIELSNKLAFDYNSLFDKQVVEVLVEEKVNNYYLGHTSNFLYVYINSNQTLNKNDLVNVKINKIFDDHVEGDIYETK